MPDITAEAAAAVVPNSDDIVTKLNGTLGKFITQIESIDATAKIKNDVPGFLKIFRHTLAESDPTRAGLFKTCMDLSHTDNRQLYDAYVAACTNNGTKYYNRSTFYEAQMQLGGILIRLFEKHRSPMAATLKDQIYEEEMYTTIALRENLATNTEVHGKEPAKPNRFGNIVPLTCTAASPIEIFRLERLSVR